MIFRDRTHAGVSLAALLRKYADDPNVVVIALPRGGVTVAVEVARALREPLDIIVPRKIGAQQNPEFAIGAVSEDGAVIWNEQERAAADPDYLEHVVAKERAEAQRRLRTYRGDRPPLDLRGKTALLIDDGVATGLTMRAAVSSARTKGAQKIIIAVPHGARESLDELATEADAVIAIDRPAWYGSVGEFYGSFPQVTDQEVISALKAAHTP